MKLIKTRPKFKCDFCNHKAGIVGMTKHEKICYKNPNRYCETCKNTGFMEDYYPEIGTDRYPCIFCSKMEHPVDKEKPLV